MAATPCRRSSSERRMSAAATSFMRWNARESSIRCYRADSMRAALLQLTSSDQPEDNLATVRAMMERAVAQGAEFILTPEVTNCVSTSRSHQNEVLHPEETDPVLAGLCQ